MNEKLKYSLIGASIGLITYLVLESLLWVIGASSNFCLSCSIIVIALNFFPILILNVFGISIFIISSIFYFLIGALMGYLIHRFKK